MINTELRENNPYSTGLIFQYPEGDFLLERTPMPYVKSPNDRYFTVIQGDSLQSISFQAYGNSKWWWVIRDINDVTDPFDLTVGTSLLIPDLNFIQIYR